MMHGQKNIKLFMACLTEQYFDLRRKKYQERKSVTVKLYPLYGDVGWNGGLAPFILNLGARWL